MKKFDVTSAINKGMILLAEPKESEKLLIIIEKDNTVVIPMIKTKTNLAYILTDDDELFEKRAFIVDEVIKSKVFKLPIYRTANKAAPEHEHTIKSFVKPAISGLKLTIPKDINKRIKEEGYSYDPDTESVVVEKRDYAPLLKNPVNKKRFEADAEKLKMYEATYEGLPLELRLAYESSLIRHSESMGMLLTGPTGTGKSFAARVLANHAGAPLLNIQITYGTTVEDLVGSFAPNTGDGGKWIFVPGPLTVAFSQGYFVVIEEVNYGQPGVLAKINEFTDPTQTRVTINGIVYERHENYMPILTMNPGYQGTETLNLALKNRLQIVDFPALGEKEFVARGQQYSRLLGWTLPKGFFKETYAFANFLEREGSSSKFHEDIKFSIRNVQRLCASVLRKHCNFEEFFEAVAVQYINSLNCDNDNSEKLSAFKASEEIRDNVKRIYEYYDFCEPDTIIVDTSLEDLVTGTDDETIAADIAADTIPAGELDDLLRSLDA